MRSSARAPAAPESEYNHDGDAPTHDNEDDNEGGIGVQLGLSVVMRQRECVFVCWVVEYKLIYVFLLVGREEYFCILGNKGVLIFALKYRTQVQQKYYDDKENNGWRFNTNTM